MANKTREYTILFSMKADGNRRIEDMETVKATTVPRAISKFVREYNEGVPEDEQLKASDYMILDVRTKDLDKAHAEFSA